MRIIDFHTHFDDQWLGRATPSEAEFLAGLDQFGVQAACVFTLSGLYEDGPRPNDALAALARRHPDRLIPFATVDPKAGTRAVDELERVLKDPLFRGVKFHPWLQAFAASMVRETMVELLRSAASHGVPVLFHDGTPPYATTFQVAALARWVPEATIVLGHAGLSDYVRAAGRLVRDIPNLFACLCGPRAGEIRALVETAGPEKCVFGSDFGFTDWTILAEFLDNLLEAGLEADILDRILYQNAAKLLHLEERPLGVTVG